jgi:hypothetical protein
MQVIFRKCTGIDFNKLMVVVIVLITLVHNQVE